jgi:hypothetical protein
VILCMLQLKIKDSFYEKLEFYSISYVPHKNIVRFQCESRKRRYFETDFWEQELT